jgi:hypothetical protein
VSGAAILGELPALPLHEAGKYVAAAYIVLFVLVLVYVAIMGIRLGRVQRDLGELLELTEHQRADSASEAGETELGVGRAQPTSAPKDHDVGRPQSTPVGAPSE